MKTQIYPYLLILFCIIFTSKIEKINSLDFDGMTDYLTNAYNGWKNEIVQSTQGYKDLLSNIYEFMRTYENSIYEKVADNANIIEKMKNIFKIVYENSVENINQEDERSEDKKLFGINFNQFYESFDISSFFKNSKSQGELFVEGVFEGISQVSLSENKCYSEIKTYKKEIVLVFEKVIVSFQTGQNLIQESVNLYEFINKLRKTTNNCDLDVLVAEIITFTNTFGSAKLAYRVFVNRKDLFSNIYSVYSKLNSQESYEAGKSFGKIVSIIFNYSTK